MGWQLINSVLRKGFGDHPESDYSFGYMIGDGNEDGYYCFSESPYVYQPFISDTFLPKFEVDGSTYSTYPLSYNDDTVWGGTSSNQWIFKPKTQNGYWVMFNHLREPYYYTDIDETTVVGDQFYKGSLPALNGNGEQWEIAGAFSSSEAGSTKLVKLTQDIWLWHDNGDRRQSQSGMCGRYFNELDGTWKSVGIPTYEAKNDQDNNCYYQNEKFSRSFEKNTQTRQFDYIGDRGHTISYSRGMQIWHIGTIGQGKWSECSTDPNVHSAVTFRGYQIDQGTGNHVEDPLGNFTLTWKHMSPGDEKREVLMGEVSLWRKAQPTL